MQDILNNYSSSIRVVVFGSGPTLQRGLKRFIARLEECPEVEVVSVLCQSDGQGPGAVARDLWRRRRFLAGPMLLALVARAITQFLSDPRGETELNRKVAELAGRIRFVPDIHSPNVLDDVRRMAPDLGLIYGSPILRPKLFEIPRLGTLGIHHGKLPEYRGKKTPFWAMYNGEATAGVTIQKVNAGLDTGDIVRQGEVHIGTRSRRAVWAELEAMGLDLYLAAILEVKNHTATYQPFVWKKGRLYRDPSLRDLLGFSLRRFRPAARQHQTNGEVHPDSHRQSGQAQRSRAQW